MEKKPASMSINKILRLIPKAAQAPASLQKLPCPSRDKRADVNPRTRVEKGYSSPIISMIPAEAREMSDDFETQDPTSPKISCIGQIKHKNKICKKKHDSLPIDFGSDYFPQPERITKARSVGPSAELKKIFGAGRNSDASNDRDKTPFYGRAPSLGQMRKMSSGRGPLANFDWTTVRIAPVDERDSDGKDGDNSPCSAELKKIYGSGRNSDASNDRNKTPVCGRAPSLGQMRKLSSGRGPLANFDWTTVRIAPVDDRDSEGEDGDISPCSPPAWVTGAVAEPRKEINLWKRRTMAQPEPLQLNMV